jgi:hypothetical protein
MSIGEQRPRRAPGQRSASPRASMSAGRSAATLCLAGLWVAAVGTAFFITQGDDDSPRARTPVRGAGPDGLAPRELAQSGPRSVGHGQARRPPLSVPLAYTYQRLLTLGDPAPDGAAHTGVLEAADLNAAGEATLVSQDEGGESLYLISPRGVKRLTRPGERMPVGPRYGGTIWTPEAVNNAGQVVWAGRVGNGETWIFMNDTRTGRQVVVARPGMAAPGGGTFVDGGRERPEINDRGQVAFTAHVAAGENAPPMPGVFVLSGDERWLVAREGTAAPHTGGPFAAAEFPAINNSGTVVFHAALSGAESLGVYRWQAEKLTTVAARGAELPSGEQLEQAFYPQVDGAGRVVFVGRTRAGDGLYCWEGGAIRPVARPGDRLPQIGRLEALDFHRRKPFHLNAAGAVAFVGLGTERKGVFLWEHGRTRIVALTGLRLPGIGVTEDLGTLDRTTGYPYGPPGAPSGPPGGPYPPPGAAGTSTGASPGYGGPPPGSPRGGPPGYGGPPPGAPRGAAPRYGGPNPGYGGGPYGYFYRGSFGIALSDDGKVLFPAGVGGQETLVLAIPKREAARG